MGSNYRCYECGYKWQSRKSIFSSPAICPRCNSKSIGKNSIFSVAPYSINSLNENFQYVSNAMEEAKEQKNRSCIHCGKIFKDKTSGAICKDFWCGNSRVCDDCMKKCKVCGKIFCPKHFNKHKIKCGGN